MARQYCKVLIVDDELIMRQGIKHILDWENEGFTIVGEASNGEDALAKIEELQPNIIISDIVMPKLDGVEFSKIVQRKYPTIQIIILSSYDDFHYVKNTLLSGAVDYILKPTLSQKELLKTLEKAVDRIPGLELKKVEEMTINRSIEKYILGYESIANVSSNQFRFNHFRLLGINLNKDKFQDKDSVNRLKDMISGYFEKSNKEDIYEIIRNNEILIFLINDVGQNDFENNFREFLQRYIKDNERYFFVLSESFKDIARVKELYSTEITPYISKKFYFKGQILLTSKNFKTIEKKKTKFDFNKFNNNLKLRKYQLAMEDIRNHVQGEIESKVSDEELKNLFKTFLYNLLINIESKDIDNDSLRKEYFQRVEKCTYIEEFQQEMEYIFNNINGRVILKVRNDDYIINEILSYINENYQNQLELSDIAKKFNYNYSYLSSYFNSRCKEGFSEYINKIRVHKACELLSENKYFVFEISSMVGYSDHSYFCRVFKRITGYTPTYYKRSNNPKEQK